MSEPSLPAMKSVIKWADAVCGNDGFSHFGQRSLALAFDDHSKQIGAVDLLVALEAMVAWVKDPSSVCPLEESEKLIERTKKVY